MRSNSIRMSSWSDRSSSANRSLRRLRGLVAMAALLLSFGERKRDAELRAATGTGAGGFDLAAVIGDDAIDNRQAQPRALAAALAREEWFKEMFEHFVRHAAPVIGKDDLGEAAGGVQIDRERTTGLDAVERIGDEIEDDLLDFLRIDGRDDRLARGKRDLLRLIFSQMADHFNHALDQLAKIGGLVLHVAEPREIEQLFRDLLATKGLRLDHPQITADD